MARALLLLACAILGALAAPQAPPREPKLIWEDNFDTLDEGKWHHMVTAWDGGNAEFQYYRNWRKNSWVDNGSLKIRPTPATEEKSDDEIRHSTIYDPTCNFEPCTSYSGPDATAIAFSARIRTLGTFDITYGKVEIRAKLPRGDFLWPALWMMPSNDAYGEWPRSGEIDIMESRGNRNLKDGNGVSQGVDSFGSTMHWGPDFNNNNWYKTHWEWRGQDLSDAFHIYTLEWTSDHLAYSIDNKEIGRVTPPAGGFWQLGGFNGNNIWAGRSKMAPFDRPFYIMMNVAVGGHFFDGLTNGGYGTPWNWNQGIPRLQFYENQNKILATWDRPQMEVDYVRVYEV